MKTHTASSQAINKELHAINEQKAWKNAYRCPSPKSTDKTTIISISILLLVPICVLALNYLGYIHNI